MLQLELLVLLLLRPSLSLTTRRVRQTSNLALGFVAGRTVDVGPPAQPYLSPHLPADYSYFVWPALPPDIVVFRQDPQYSYR